MLAVSVIIGIVYLLSWLGRNHGPNGTSESFRWPAWTRPYRNLFKEPDGLTSNRETKEFDNLVDKVNLEMSLDQEIVRESEEWPIPDKSE